MIRGAGRAVVASAVWITVTMLAPSEAHADEENVRVVLDATYDTELEKRVGARWQHVCAAPCGYSVDRHARYRIRGGHLTEPRYLVLGDEEEITVRVRRPESVFRDLGKTLFMGGLSVAAAGVIMSMIGFASHGIDASSPGCRHARDRCFPSASEAGLVIAGGFALLAGLSSAVAGGVMWLSAPGPTTSIAPRATAFTAPIVSYTW